MPLKRNADEAVAAPTVKKVVVLRRTGDDVPFDESRDLVARATEGNTTIRPRAARADGRRGSALSPLHVGDDREAKGDRA